MKNVILLGRYPRGIEKAKALGYHVTFINKKEKLKLDEITLADEVFGVDINDEFYLENVFRLVSSNKKVDGIFSFQEFGVENASKLAKKFGFTHINEDSIEVTRNKSLMRDRILHTKKLEKVPYSIIKNKGDIVKFIERFDFPFILKPVDGAGSINVSLITDFNDLNDLTEDIYDLDVIAEKYISGMEVSVEAITIENEHHIISITDKITSGPPHFIEIGHFQPSNLTVEQKALICQTVKFFLDEIKLNIGPSHTEVIINEQNQIYIIESHTRPGGDRIHELTELSTGIDMCSTTLKYLIDGQKTLRDVTKTKASAIRYFEFSPGKVKAIHGLDQLKHLPNLYDYQLNVNIGDEIIPATSSLDRHGYIMISGTSREDVERTIMVALDTIKIEYYEEVD